MEGSADGDDRFTRFVIGCAFAVANGLGAGFLEKVYENALANKLRDAGLVVEQQHAVNVWFEGRGVGHYVADLVVGRDLVLELKALDALTSKHVAQALNFLKASRLPTCLLMNFGGRRAEVRRLYRPD